MSDSKEIGIWLTVAGHWNECVHPDQTHRGRTCPGIESAILENRLAARLCENHAGSAAEANFSPNLNAHRS